MKRNVGKEFGREGKGREIRAETRKKERDERQTKGIYKRRKIRKERKMMHKRKERSK
jgi:hypothetical protein